MHRRERSAGGVRAGAPRGRARAAGGRLGRALALAVAALAVAVGLGAAPARALPAGPPVVGVALATSPPTPRSPTPDTAPGDGDEVAPPPGGTVTDFYPEQEDLSDCIGLVERPGCGSDARGGWRQGLVFAVVVVGLGLIAWRIVVAARRGRSS